MAFGKHWEWRGFGRLQAQQQAVLSDLTPLPTAGHWLHDVYLWAPDCATNVKLRAGNLKFKRMLAKQDIYEHWLEDEAEVYPFPLTGHVIAELNAALGTHLSTLPDGTISRQQLELLMQENEPQVHTLVVRKHRRQYLWPSGDHNPVLVEWTEVSEPEDIITLSLEHHHVEPIQEVLKALDLPASALRTMNYLEALAHWVENESIIQGC